MAEPVAEGKQDNFEESMSTEEWTIIGRRSSKDSDSKEKADKKNAEQTPAEESAVEEDAPLLQESEEKDVDEQGEEANEQDDKDNEAESDGVSVISDDEQPNQAIYSEKRIQKLERKALRKQSSLNQLEDKAGSARTLDNRNKLIMLSMGITMLAFFLGLMSGSKFSEIPSEELHNQCAFHSYKKIKSFTENFDQLHQMADRLDNLHNTWPKIQDHVNGLSESIKNFMNLKISLEDSLTNVKNRAELVAALYMNFCLISNKINSGNPQFKPKECQVPSTIDRFIYYKKEFGKDTDFMRRESKRNGFPKEMTKVALKQEEKIDVIVESLLSKFIDAFSTFTKEVESATGPSEFENLSEEYTILREENNYSQEFSSEKSKGEVKNDNWKKNKYENNEKFEEKKYKREKYENQKKNNKNSKQKRDYDSSQESHERENDSYRKYDGNKKERDYDRKSDYDKKSSDFDRQSYRKKKNNEFFEKKERDTDYKYKKGKKEYDFERKFEHNKKVSDYDNKSEHEKNYGEQEFEHKHKKDNGHYDRDHKKYCSSGHNCDKKMFNGDEDDHKYSKYTKNGGNRFIEVDERRRNEYPEINDEQNGDWLINRAGERARQRNSDWYSARADSRQQARTETRSSSGSSNGRGDHRRSPSRSCSRRSSGSWRGGCADD